MTDFTGPAATYHVRKISIGFKRKYRIFADNGSGAPGRTLFYADKSLKVSEELTLYRDERRSDKVAIVRESDEGWLAALTGYQVRDPDEQLLGSFAVLPRKSVQRTTWQLDQPGLGTAVGTERSVAVARARRLLTLGGVPGQIAGTLVKYHFDFERSGVPVFSIERPKVFDDWYRVLIYDEATDPRLLWALAVTMESRQRG